MGVLASYVPVATAMVLHGFIQIISNFSRAAFLRKHISWAIIGRYALAIGGALLVLLMISWRPTQTMVFILLGHWLEMRARAGASSAITALMDLTPTKTFKDGELLVGGIWAIQLKDQKSPGESALFIQQRKGVLILGDALIGKPSGALSMLPAEKYADREKAKDGLRRLLKYEFDSVLVGDGVSIMTGAKPILEQALQ